MKFTWRHSTGKCYSGILYRVHGAKGNSTGHNKCAEPCWQRCRRETFAKIKSETIRETHAWTIIMRKSNECRCWTIVFILFTLSDHTDSSSFLAMPYNLLFFLFPPFIALSPNDFKLKMARAASKLHKMKTENASEFSANKMDSDEHRRYILRNNGGSGWERIAETKLNIPRWQQRALPPHWHS